MARHKHRPPHFDNLGAVQFVSFNLSDSLPRDWLARLKEGGSLAAQNQDKSGEIIARWLQAGLGRCVLRHAAVARVLQDALLHADGQRYDLLAWCIMPNHVHALIKTRAPLGRTVQLWKSHVGRWLAKHGAAAGVAAPVPLWQRQYWDRRIRDDEHYWTTVAYIHNNPVSANLCSAPEAWQWSSARFNDGRVYRVALV